MQSECWRIYQEMEPAFYSSKEPWQSRVIVPKPFAAVQYAAAAIKKAFSPDFLSIRDEKNPGAERFWQRLMEVQTNEMNADFVLTFISSLLMALAVGESMEMIPHYKSETGLSFDLVEPWKIHRDPDAPARDSQGGHYWIHQEWTPWWQIKEASKGDAAKYFDVDRILNTEGVNPSDPFMTQEAVAARKGQIWQRGTFNKLILLSEFWGVVLDKKGELLLPRATYVIAGDRVIQKPSSPAYSRLRWPGVRFSPLPNLLGFGGRGILQSVRRVWESMNNLLCMHEDALKWVIMPPYEIDIDRLTDPEDAECWPGKPFLVRESVNGQQAIRPMDRRDVTNSTLANLAYYDQNFQRGAFTTDAVQGLPGYRQDMTYRESAMLMDQALGGFAIMGEHVERGCVWALEAGRDAIETFATLEDYLNLFTQEELAQWGIQLGTDGEKVVGLPPLSGRFHVSGIQAMLKQHDTLQNIKEIVLPLSSDPKNPYAKYINRYNTMRAVEIITNMEDEKIFVDEATGSQLAQMDLQQAVAVGFQSAEMAGQQPPEETPIPEGGMV